MTDPASAPMEKRRLLAAILGTLVLAVLIVLAVVLPAEYGRDPLGVGRLSGLSRLWAPDQETVDVRGGGGPAARGWWTTGSPSRTGTPARRQA